MIKNFIYIILLLPLCVDAQCTGSLNNNLLSITTTYPDFVNGVCAGTPVDFTAVVESNTSTTLVYQWQESIDGGVIWTDIFGETLEGFIATGSINGNQYRFQVGEAADVAEPTCTFTSPPIIVNYYDISSNVILPIFQCDLDANGEEYDLIAKIPEIINGDDPSNYNITFHNTITDMENGTNSLPSPYQPSVNPWIAYVRVENLVKGCVSNTANPIQFTAQFYTTPPVNSPIPTLSQCDDDTDGISVFNLTNANSLIISNPSSFDITYYNTLIGAQNQDFNDQIQDLTAYTNPPPAQPQEVYAYVIDSDGCSGIEVTVPLQVTSSVVQGTPKFIDQCDDNTGGGAINDGIGTFNLTSVRDEIISDYPPGNYEVGFYQNQADALAQINEAPLVGYQNTASPFSQDLFVRVIDLDNNNSCAGLGQHVTLSVSQQPVFEVESPQYICSNDLPKTLTVINPQDDYTYVWYQYNNNGVLSGVVGLDIIGEAYSPGTYTVVATNANGSGCSTSREIEVLPSSIATITNIESDTTIQNGTITVDFQGESDEYEYNIDFQDFEDVNIVLLSGSEGGTYTYQATIDNPMGGNQTVRIRDRHGCGIAIEEICVLGFPKFFTPTGDNINDRWQVFGGEECFDDAVVRIFDRYGKLMKQLSSDDEGWNGTYNGRQVPATDYWFTVEFADEDLDVYKGHFSLKR